MKKLIVALFGLCAFAAGVFAQTHQEILDRMCQVVNEGETKGLSMVIDMKIPIIGTLSSTIISKGDKSRIDSKLMGKQIIVWTDKDTEWEYSGVDNEITIKTLPPDKKTEAAENLDMFDGLTVGYDTVLKKETDTTWEFRLNKRSDNTEKDDPKHVDVVVEKGTYLPRSITTSLSGVKMTMRNFTFKISEKDLTFNKADFPDAKIVDNRN